MKNIFIYLLGIGILLVSCEKDIEVIKSSLTVSNERVTPSHTSAEIAVDFAPVQITDFINSGTNFDQVFVQYATSKDFAEYQEEEMQHSGWWRASLTNLQPNTTYYVRYFVKNKYSSAISNEVSEFKTLALSLPSITTSEVTQIMDTSAIVGGNVTADGGASVTERGVVYSTSPNPTTANSKVTSGSGTGSFTCSLTNLQEGTTYYVRAYAINEKGTAYGEQKSFTTKAYALPTVTTSSVTNISKTSATVGGNVTSDGGMSVAERGVVYSTSSNPTTSNSKVTSGSGMGSFTCSLTNLQEGTTYYVRAYAVNEKGTAYGEQKSFTTSSVALPTVTTSSATNISKTSATVGGKVTSDGGASVTERGVVYSTVSNPVINNIYHTTKVVGSGTGSFSVNLTNLVEGTTYYVRAYATNEKGTAYGNQVVFTTLEAPIENVHEYVDLGLSVKWATCNVGASSPEDYGDYFAWGETQPKSTYKWSTYKYCNGSYNSLTKYNNSSSFGTVDNKTQLELSDDAARANWGGSWRMPTRAEQDELRNNCTWTWTTQNGVKGRKVTSKSNGNSIFLPAAGDRYDGSLYDAGSYGYYWSSSLYTGTPSGAHYLFFGSSNVDWFYDDRYYGRSVRPVCP